MAKGPIFVKFNGASVSLVPASEFDHFVMSELADGKEYRIDKLIRPRSLPQHRFLFGVFKQVIDATDLACDVDTLLRVAKTQTGLMTGVEMPDGRMIWVEQSISFERMDQDQFNRFVNAALKWLSSTFGIDIEALWKMVPEKERNRREMQ